MSRKLLFVHGINVRGEAYFRSFDLAARKAKRFLKQDWEVVGCQWGDPFGARLNKKGKSIPGYDRTGDSEPATDDAERALWFLLAADPLLELRILPVEQAFGANPGVWIWQQFANLGHDREILDLLTSFGVEGVWTGFIQKIESDQSWKTTVEAITLEKAAASEPVAKAVTAAFLIYLRNVGYPGLSAAQRDELRTALLNPLGGPPMGFGGYLAEKLLHAGGKYAAKRRGQMTDLTTPGVGDILYYQSRGEKIRNFIGKTLRENGVSAILAHSLGGVACVDWLADKERRKEGKHTVEKLITIGSQAPYFYELGALASRRFGSGLPEFFPAKWLNFFDRADLLSFQGKEIFPGHIEDCEVESGQPFPDSHSAYLQNDEQVWKKIAEFLG